MDEEKAEKRGPDQVVELGAYIESEVRELAKAAHLARLRHEKAQAEVGQAMRAFADACVRFDIAPGDITIGKLSGLSFTPANHPASRLRSRRKP